MLISDEYREQMRALHSGSDRDLAFGYTGHRWSTPVQELRTKHECQTVLDYGCGQGTLGVALDKPEWFREYDPAVAGKDEDPDRAHMVVCTDVLEHIEPEYLDNVLADLKSKIERVGLLNIATRPAMKTLPDGRNAHLLIHDAPWWQDKISEYFNILDWDVQEIGEVMFVVDNGEEMGEIKTMSAVSETVRAENLAINVKLTGARLGILPPNRSTAVLVCYGPSLHDEWEGIGKYGGYICTVSGAHDFLIDRGIVPAAHVEADAREMKSHYTAKPNAKTQYLIASCCHPATVKQLLDQNLALWHIGTDQPSLDMLRTVEPGAIAIGGGGSVGLRAMAVLYTMGFRRFRIYGMDCSFAEDGEQHAGMHTGTPQNETSVRVGDRWFRSSLVMVTYAHYFFRQVANFNHDSEQNGEPLLDCGQHIEVALIGDSLLTAYATEKERLYQQETQNGEIDQGEAQAHHQGPGKGKGQDQDQDQAGSREAV